MKKIQKEENECRPICMFNLKDRIVLSIVNKFLTYLFDSTFCKILLMLSELRKIVRGQKSLTFTIV